MFSKNIALAASAVVLAGQVLAVSSAYAEPATNPGQLRREMRTQVQEDRKEVKEDANEVKTDRLDLKKDVNELKNTVKTAVLGNSGRVVQGQVTAINGTTLTVTQGGKTYTVNTSTKTQFQRHFWGKSSLSEISVNDLVNVIGKWTDTNKTAIDASMIRDVSIMKRFGTFFGTITSTGSGTFVMQSLNRGNQTVTVSTSTKVVNRKEQTMGVGDLKVGDKVRVKGMWDNKNGTVTEVTQVKDFTQPVVATGTPTPTSTTKP